jgi:hypothetical protein
MWHSIRSPDMSCLRMRSRNEDGDSFRIDRVDFPAWKRTHLVEHHWAREPPSISTCFANLVGHKVLHSPADLSQARFREIA